MNAELITLGAPNGLTGPTTPFRPFVDEKRNWQVIAQDMETIAVFPEQDGDSDRGQVNASRAFSALRACAGLSLPSDVPVGALREVVEALRGHHNAMGFLLAQIHCGSFPGASLETYYRQQKESFLALEKLNQAVLSQLSEPTPSVEDKGPEIELPFSVIMDKCWDWDAFCNEVGLNPWCVKEGLASGNDTYSAPLSTFQKHGII